MPYRYAGLEPVPDGEGGIVRPGEIRDEAPESYGPWEEIPGPEDGQDAPAEPAPPKSTASGKQAASDDSASNPE